MQILWQILKEFWLAIILAAVWTAYNIPMTQEWGFKEAINIFVPSFFLVSWATGQFFRVKKQTRVESNLNNIETRLEHLINNLEIQTQELINNVTGGESFVYLAPTKLTNTRFPESLMIIHQGQHTIYDLSIRVVDVNEFKSELMKSERASNLLDIGINKTIGNVSPKSAVISGISIKEKEITQLTIQFSTRNGHFSQDLHIRRVGSDYKAAIRVKKFDNSSESIFEKVDDGYPLNSTGQLDW